MQDYFPQLKADMLAMTYHLQGKLFRIGHGNIPSTQDRWLVQAYTFTRAIYDR